MYNPNIGVGIFAVCKPCWEELKIPINRLPYYRALWHKWGSVEAEWELIENAVLEGK